MGSGRKQTRPASRGIDIEKLRGALRRLRRGDLLSFAERAIELVPRTKLRELVGDTIQSKDLVAENSNVALLHGEVRKFHAACLRGEYYESFNVNSRNFTEKSERTEWFIDEFNRLTKRCVQSATGEPKDLVREMLELLFDLLRRIDKDSDDIVFFADEAGSWQVSVDWRAVFPAYFACLADCATDEQFACEVDRVIADFADYERPRHLTAARRVASAAQKAAIRRLMAHR